MAFAIRDLSVLAYANGFTLWHHKAGEGFPRRCRCHNYFADASDMMAGGDMVMVSGAGGSRIFCVALADAGKVVTAPLG